VVLVTAQGQGTGELSGIETGSDWNVLYTLRSGRIVDVRFFFERGAALDAAGFIE
jgi:hypothetical protein